MQNLSGGITSARSLRQLSGWCADRLGSHEIIEDATPRPFDLPWVVLDHALATEQWGWSPETGTDAILEEIAAHAEADPGWLERSL